MQFHSRRSVQGLSLSLWQFMAISCAMMAGVSLAELPFTKEYLGCVGDDQGPNCAKEWKFTGGPGYVGHRLDHDMKIKCSPSCTDVNNPKICSLILVLHGIYSNPGDMVRLLSLLLHRIHCAYT